MAGPPSSLDLVSLERLRRLRVQLHPVATVALALNDVLSVKPELADPVLRVIDHLAQLVLVMPVAVPEHVE
jgi:hypothetical protein